MHDTRAKLPATKRKASMTCPLAMVSGFAPRRHVALPGAAGGALQRAVTHAVDVTGQHLAHIAGLDQLLHVQQRRADPRLQADRGLHALGLGQRRQLFGFGGGAAQRPLGVDMLAGFDGGLGRLIVRWHPHHHGHRVDLRSRPPSPGNRGTRASLQTPCAPLPRSRAGWCRPRSIRHPGSPAAPERNILLPEEQRMIPAVRETHHPSPVTRHS